MRSLNYFLGRVSIVGAVACATGHPSMKTDTITLPARRVSVPQHADSAWAVAIATSVFADDVNKRFDVLSFCSDRNGFLVDVTPAGPPRTLGGGGLVFISLSGTVLVLVPYQ